MLASQLAALVILACALGALLVAALASTGRNDTSVPRVATPPSAEAGVAEPPSSTAQARPEPRESSSTTVARGSGETVVRTFYDALGRGDGDAASALVVAEKRGGRAFSPQAISRFYGDLPEPLRLTAVTPLADDTYRVSYRYSAGRSRCDGAAVVSLTSRDGRTLIRSIRALNGC
ncbi:nuclear transport factor 2 family protein [Sphingomonas lenta]|uniref:Uncharacterized protein n=1 Tax=Sphingomonas lenta TaxID=1141887 RepID=A0A2A2SDU1_9SPHN|nr:hypothetical protein [Sphingomonas lenta]PAX07375.1 hypothetical protein CKY28_15285 [Sphingomonas lenta]